MLQKQGPQLILCRHKQICYYVKANSKKKKEWLWNPHIGFKSLSSSFLFCSILFCSYRQALSLYPGPNNKKTVLVSSTFFPLPLALHLLWMGPLDHHLRWPAVQTIWLSPPLPSAILAFEMFPEYIMALQFFACSHSRKSLISLMEAWDAFPPRGYLHSDGLIPQTGFFSFVPSSTIKHEDEEAYR